MGELTLKLFGPLQVRHAGRLLAFPTRKAAALLVYLAVEGGPQPREKITALFWPESNSERGRATLRKTLAYLRQTLGEDDGGHAAAHVSGDREAVRLDAAAGVGVDLWTVRAAVEAARDPRPHVPTTIDRLAAAAELCTGEFLEGFSLGDAPEFDDWCSIQREAWHRRAGLIYDRLSQLQFDSGDITSAIGTTARWTAHDRLDEGAHRRLMRLYAAAGQRAAALEVYETYRATLLRELNAEPGQQTQTLAGRIRADEAALTAAASPPETARPAATTTLHDAPLVGRASEHHRLAEAYRQARRGQLQVVVLEGEPGIGKTRLARDFLTWAAAQRAEVLRGRALESGGRLPYQALVEALRERLEREADPERLLSATWLAELSRLLPELTDRLPDLPSPDNSNEAEARTRLYEAVARAGLALAARAPTVLFIDDLHWSDASSLELLQYAARRWASANPPLLLLLALRSEELAVRRELANWLQDLERDLAVTRIALGPLGADEARQLVHSFGQGQTPEAGHPLNLPAKFDTFTQQLFIETGGRPFFIVQVLRLLAERGLLARDEAGEWTANPAQAIPASLRELMRGRLSRLSPTAQACSEAGAVLGDGFDFSVMARLAGVDDREALTALDELLARGLLREASGMQLHFGHDRIREAVYAELSETRRRLLHREALVALGEAAPPSQLARHALAGGLPEAALQHSLAAGEEALRIFAVRSAIGHYERALALLGEEAPGAAWPAAKLRQKASVQRTLAECLQTVGDYAAALAAYGAAGDNYARAGEQTEAGAIQRQMGRVYWERGEGARAMAHYQRSLAMLAGHPKQRGTWRQRLGHYQQAPAMLAAIPESVELARTISSLAQMYMLAGELEAAIVYGERALALARRLEAADVERYTLVSVGATHSYLGRPDVGLPLLQEGLALALRAGSVYHACRAYTNTAEVLSLLLCRYDEARALVQEMLAYAANAQAMLFIGTALYDLALIDWLTGRWPEALAACEQMRAWMGSHEASASKVWASMLLGRIENDLGRPEQAWTILEAELPRARSLDDLQSTVPHLAQLARAYWAGGRETEAQALMREYLAQIERTTAYDPTANATLLFACQWYAGQRTPAGLETARKCLAWLEQTSAGGQRPATLAAWHEAQGSLLLASGEAAPSAQQLAHAAEQWAAIGHRYDQMRALAHLSRARQRAGDAAGAAAAREATLGLVERLAAQLPGDERRDSFVRAATSWTVADG